MEHKFEAPSDLVQIPIVWRYELLKHFRSWRLFASIAIAVVVLALIFFLPPALGHPYSGTDTDVELELTYLGTPATGMINQTLGVIGVTGVDISGLTVEQNGNPYSDQYWDVIQISDQLDFMGFPQGTYAIMFAGNVTGSEMTATYDWQITAESFDSLNLNFVNILIIICATFFGADALVGEFSSRTGYLIFPNPLKREMLFAGKFAASMTAGLVVVTLFYAGVFGLSYAAAGEADDDIGMSFLFAIEYLLAATAIGYVISSLLKGTTGAIVLTFMLLFLLLPIIDGIAIFTGVKIAASVTFSAGVLIYILQDPYPVDTSQDIMGFTFTNFYPDPTISAIVMFLYAAIGIAISMIIFKRKQLVG